MSILLQLLIYNIIGDRFRQLELKIENMNASDGSSFIIKYEAYPYWNIRSKNNNIIKLLTQKSERMR